MQGVTSRVVGNIPHQLVSGSVQRAWGATIGRDSKGNAASGMASVRGWKRSGTRAVGGGNDGYTPPLFEHLVEVMSKLTCWQYMFVALHHEGREAVQRVLNDANAQVMVKVPHGRMGHRAAWWHMDRREGEDVDWPWRRRGVADDEKEDVWLVRLGNGSTVSGRQAERAVEALEDVGTHYVAGGLAGMELAWGRRRVKLGEDVEYIDDVGRWMSLGGRSMTVGERKLHEQAEGIDMQATFASMTLEEGVDKVRGESKAWLRCGVVTDAVDWFAEHAAGMGSQKRAMDNGGGTRAAASGRRPGVQVRSGGAPVGRVPWSVGRGRRAGRRGLPLPLLQAVVDGGVHYSRDRRLVSTGAGTAGKSRCGT